MGSCWPIDPQIMMGILWPHVGRRESFKQIYKLSYHVCIYELRFRCCTAAVNVVVLTVWRIYWTYHNCSICSTFKNFHSESKFFEEHWMSVLLTSNIKSRREFLLACSTSVQWGQKCGKTFTIEDVSDRMNFIF